VPYVYVGTYTSSRSEGIYVYRFDATTGDLEPIQTLVGVEDPSYLAFAPGGQFLYAVNERERDPEGSVSAFSVDSATGRLEPLNRVPSRGAIPAHLSVDPTGRWVLVANYGGGTISSFPIQSDGSLGEAADVVQHTGNGPNPTRQRGPHPHMIVTDPNNRFVLVPDLGLDRVVAYRLDTSSGRLVAQPQGGGVLDPGAGPRHLAFGPGGRHVYVLNEIASTLSLFDYHAETGHMHPVETLSTLPADYTPASTTAAVVVHPSGRFIYASNRGHDSIAAFGLEPLSGRLTPLGQTPTGGRAPRDFNIDPAGAFLLAANKDSDSLATFRINVEDGAVQPTGFIGEVPSPARVLITS